jgi:predicted TIM-barrel fold metal-dependent hydrolase
MHTGSLISADNHLNTQWLPRDLWQSRLPADLRERGPRVVETDEGSFWHWEGARRRRSADGSSHEKVALDEYAGFPLEPGVLPPSQPQVMLTHLDRAGVESAVFYGDTRKWAVRDPVLRIAMVRSFNDFSLELTASAPDRLLYLPTLPTRDPEACLPECRRLLRLGVRAVEFPVFDLAEPPSSPVWEPIWQEAAAHGVVLCSHTGHPAGTSMPTPQGGSLYAHHATSPFRAAAPIADMVFSGVFERHPSLHWVMAECRIGWLPFLISWMDRQVEIRQPDDSVSLSMKPSEYVRQNICFTFENDVVGARLLGCEWSLLQDIVMWGMDYPHPQQMWPDPWEKINPMLADLDPAVRHQVLYGRAASLFGLGRSSVMASSAA